MINLVRADDLGSIALYGTKKEAQHACKALRSEHGYTAEVRPERAENRFFRFWVIAVEPVGDPGEARIVRTTRGTWATFCKPGCKDPVGTTGVRGCGGHLLDADSSHTLDSTLV